MLNEKYYDRELRILIIYGKRLFMAKSLFGINVNKSLS